MTLYLELEFKFGKGEGEDSSSVTHCSTHPDVLQVGTPGRVQAV